MNGLHLGIIATTRILHFTLQLDVYKLQGSIISCWQKGGSKDNFKKPRCIHLKCKSQFKSNNFVYTLQLPDTPRFHQLPCNSFAYATRRTGCNRELHPGRSDRSNFRSAFNEKSHSERSERSGSCTTRRMHPSSRYR
jgi:hypothetical protein